MPWLNPLGNAICLYCFERFHLSRAPLRDISPKAVGQEDEVLANFFGIPPRTMGPVHPAPTGSSFWSRLGRRFYIPPEQPDERRICPHCHIFLPNKVANGELTSEMVAIVGARSSGKSNYFGVLIKLLQKRYANEVGFDILDVDTYIPAQGQVSSNKLYQERYGQHLFGIDPKAVGQTFPVETVKGTSQDPRIPLIYMLRFSKQLHQFFTAPFKHKIPIYLAFYDACGEEMLDKAVMEQFYRFIRRATGIIFLIDPFQYPGLYRQLPAEVQKQIPLIGTEPADVVDIVVRLFHERERVRADSKIAVPVAFVLTKSDLLKHIDKAIHPGSPIARDSHHTGGFDAPDSQELSREVMQCIANWESSELVDKAKSFFHDYSFFAMSALGGQPDDGTNRLKTLSPLRVIDPLVWLLWRRGYLSLRPIR